MIISSAAQQNYMQAENKSEIDKEDHRIKQNNFLIKLSIGCNWNSETQLTDLSDNLS